MSGLGKKANCGECGWEGPERDSPGDAHEDLQKHSESAHGGTVLGHVGHARHPDNYSGRDADGDYDGDEYMTADDEPDGDDGGSFGG